MEYTKQELTDAYIAATGTLAEDLEAKKVEIQATLDESRARITARIAFINTNSSERLEKAQERLDSTPLLAKEQMKDIAISYLISQIKEQTETDNENISL
jgi:hypothetical protein